MQNFSTYSLSSLKSYCSDNGVHVTGDKRRKSSYIESIEQHQRHNETSELNQATTLEAHYDLASDTTTVTTTISNQGWLSEALSTEPTPEELALYAEADSHIKREPVPVEEPTPTPEEVPTTAPTNTVATPALVLLLPILCLLLALELTLRLLKPTIPAIKRTIAAIPRPSLHLRTPSLPRPQPA